MNKKIISTLLIAIAVLFGGYLFLSKYDIQLTNKIAKVDSPEVAPKAVLTVDLVRPTSSQMADTIAANGSIAPWQEAVIGSEANGLMLSQVLVNVGDYVKKGQLLAQFSASTITADIAQAQANLAEAKASALEAADNATRARSIKDSGALSAQQIEQYLALEATSRARVAAAQATLQSGLIRNKQTKVISPDSGVISARAATVGAVVSPGQELFKLIRQGRLEWRAELTSSDISQIQNGMKADITLPNGNTMIGKVRSASPMVDTQTRNAIVFVDIASASAKAGMFARGTFNIGTKEVVTLPATAVVMKDGFAYALQVGTDGRVRQLKIQTGGRQGANVEVIGLDDAIDSNYVAAGGAFLADGDLVTVAGKTPMKAKPISKKE